MVKFTVWNYDRFFILVLFSFERGAKIISSDLIFADPKGPKAGANNGK